MEIHRFEKLWLVGSLVLIVGFILTITYGAVGAGVAMVDDSGGTVQPDDFSGTGFEDPGVERVGEDRYEVHVVALQFGFNPGSSDPIRLPADSTVTFQITSPDVIHGFSIVGTNVNVMVIPGQVSEITVRFDDPAEYGIVCHEYCGSGHHTMAGSIEIVPQDEYGGESQ